ncbi:hypothetical protein OH76DRAFT_1368922 [Lentinus brumalis]|uniref:Uncharacterized protein n=1 Tax=Lentinus brumalis TaxID=2498619 RepID=A0A371DUX5_9APHY|nr:hypothetical protein OH76DRAFT_1368922 [Polyporus brumalis]
MFGEPSTPKSTLGTTYSTKRKFKDASPRPGGASDAGSSLSRAQSLTESSPNKLPTNSGPSSGRGGRGRSGRRSRGRSNSPSSSIENKSLALSDPEIIVLDDASDDPVKPSTRRNNVGHTDDRSINPTAPKVQIATGKGPRKRALSHSSSAGSDSGGDLTPLSSPEVVVKKKVFPPTTNIAPRLARQFLRAQTQAQLPAVSQSKHAPVSQSKSLDNLFAPLDSTDDESVDEAETGSLVWVSIDLQGRLTDCDENGEEDTLWWPAKVVELPRPLLRVLLLGEPPGSGSEPRKLSISTPSASNVRSMMLDGRVRFNEENYRPSRRDPIRSSPRKKRKLDIETAWQEARDLMVKMNEDSDDDLLTPSTRYGTRPSASHKIGGATQEKGKGKAKAVESDFEDEFGLDLSLSQTQRRWRAPSADLLLEIPGELVLAKEGKTRTQYWPAKLLEYIKPLKQSQRPKYKVIFFDGTVAQIEQDWFWTTSDDEFATCKLGESTGNYGLDHDNDVLDELEGAEDFNQPFAPEDEATLRSPSPLPELPAPSPETFQYDMEIAEEFEYIKPILAAVLDNEYGPAKARHEGFMRGGGARRKVLDAIPLRGSLNAKEKEEVAYYVRSWARRRDRRLEMGLSVDYPRDKLYLPADSRQAKPLSRGHDSDADSVLTPASDISAVETELLALSEEEAPPSSFAATDIGTDDEKVLSAEDHREHESAVPEDAMNVSHGDASSRPSENVLAQVDEASEAAPTVEKLAADGLTPAAPRRSFHDLDALEKLTYCNNVLLQEAILQILLWRTGKRKDLGLLSPEEEQHLHDIAMQEGEKTNWVHDIIRMRQAMEKTMLPSSKSKSKGKATGAARGSRTRTRRGGA